MNREETPRRVVCGGGFPDRRDSMVQIMSGKVVKNYRSEGLMVLYLDPKGREYQIRQSPAKRVWSKNCRERLTAVEQACESFLIEEEYDIPSKDMPFSAIKVVYYQREMGKPKINETVIIKLGGVNKIKLEVGMFSVLVDNAHRPATQPTVIKMTVLTDSKKTKPNLLIRR